MTSESFKDGQSTISDSREIFEKHLIKRINQRYIL